MAIQPIKGKKYARLVALRPVADSTIDWVFECECGVVKRIRSYGVLTGRVKSCGCLNRENIGKVRRTHGATGSALHRVYWAVRSRCNYNVGHPQNTKNYFERGIRVCDEWLKFEAFQKWALENGYKKGLHLDRINNHKGYSPDNCRWVTAKENNRNRRNSWVVQTEHGPMSMPEAMEKLKMTRPRIFKEFEGKVFRVGDLQKREVL